MCRSGYHRESARRVKERKEWSKGGPWFPFRFPASDPPNLIARNMIIKFESPHN